MQLFVNTADHENHREWLPDWLAEHGLEQGDFDRARRLREALRALLYVNNQGGAAPEAEAEVSRAAADVRIELEGGRPVLAGEGPLGEVTAVALGAMLDGTWPRLKVCRNCEWAFYDTSKNRSGSWCSMRLCGNRLKTKAYRRRLSEQV